MRIIGDAVFAGLGKLKNALMDPQVVDPANPAESQLWYNSTDKSLRFYDGAVVQTLAVGGNTAALLTEINAIESSIGLNDDGTFTVPDGTNYIGTADTVNKMSVLLDAALKAVSDQADTTQTGLTNLTSTVSTLQAEVDAVEVSVGLNADGTYSAPAETNYLGNAHTVKAALVALDTELKIAETNISTKVDKAGDTMTGNLAFGGAYTLTGLRAASDPTEPVRKAEFDAAEMGRGFEADINGFEGDYTNVADRYIFVDGSKFTAGATGAHVNDIVRVNATGVVTAVEYKAVALSPTDPGVIVWDKLTSTYWAWNGTAWSEHGGLVGITAGVGLSKSGNTINVNLGAGIGQLPTDEVSVDIRPSSGLFLTEDGTTASGNTGAQLAIQLNGVSLANTASGIKVAASGITATELAASVAGGGLVGGAGTPLAVGAGSGITVNADSIQVDTVYLNGIYARQDGATFTGPVVVPAPVADSQAARKIDVDTVNSRFTSSYVLYNGSTSSATHIITHNLNQQYPQVTVYDSNNRVIIPDEIAATDANTTTVSFAAAITCKVAISASKA